MAWKLDGATFVDGDNGLAYSVSLYERLEASSGEAFMARKGPLTEEQARAAGFDLADVLAALNTSALAALDAAREDAAAKAAEIVTLEGDLNVAADQRNNLSGRLTDALAEVAAGQQEIERLRIEAAARIAALEAERDGLATVVAEQSEAIAARDAAVAALTSRIAETPTAGETPSTDPAS